MFNIFFPFFLFLISLAYRSYGLLSNYPFWVDEFSTGKVARQIITYGLGYFTQPNIVVERHNITTYFITALFFKLFGQHEWAARLPFVIFGSLLPVGVYFLAKKLFDAKTALCASIFTTFSYLMITWSRQAREFSFLQLLIVLNTFFYFNLLTISKSEKRKRRINWTAFIITIILGIVTHVTFYIFIAALGLHFFFYNRAMLSQSLKKPQFLLIGSITLVLLLFGIWRQGIFLFFNTSFFGANNLWYYHAFLWREYGLITFLTIAGGGVGLLKKSRETSFFLLYITFQLIFVCSIWGHYLSKYILTIFPFLFILASYFIAEATTSIIESTHNKRFISKKLLSLMPVLLTLLIIVQGNKFVVKPKKYYSINHDFREIANIDYHQVYNIVKNKGAFDDQTTAIIETWPDRAKWYLGTDIMSVYYFRWQNEEGKASGHSKKTPFKYDGKGEKRLISKESLGFIGELSDLQKAMQKYPRGFIFIDDSTLPHDVIEYAEKNLKKELYLDHYPLDDNPYSIWPATLYSWGIN